MLIVKEDALIIHNGKALYQGRGFDGVSLAIVDGVIVDRKMYRDSVFLGDYSSPLFSSYIDDLSIVSTALDDEYGEPCTYHGSPYSGVSYCFSGELCVAERGYKSGWLMSEVIYREDGSIESIDIGDDKLSQKCEWFDDGSIKEFEIFERDCCRLWLKFSSKSVLSTLVIEGDYFNRVRQIEDKLFVKLFGERELIEGLIGSTYLFMSGDRVNDEFFKKFISNDGLRKTERLNIFNTSVSCSSINELVPVKSLKEISVATKGVSLQCLKSFKLQRQECKVEFNRETVV